MSAVSTHSGATPFPRRGQSTLLSAVIAVGAIAGWLAYEHWVHPHVSERLLDIEPIRSRWWLFTLLDSVPAYLLYAIVLLLWGRTPRRRVGAALVAVGTVLFEWALYVMAVEWLKTDSTSDPWVQVYVWTNVLLIPTGIALAWGVARRWGRVWPVGLVAAPVLAAVTRELAIHSTWWRTHLLFADGVSHDLTRRLVFIAPAVIAAVVCWLIDGATTRRTTSGPAAEPSPEMQSSA
jgi:hypothetical protein